MTFTKLKNFIGKKVYFLLICSVVAGIAWFLVELSFIYIFQYFLYSLKLIDKAQLAFNADMIGSSSYSGLILLVIFGMMRFLTSFFKTVMSSFVQHTFIQEKRSRTLELALQNAGKLPTGLILSIFSETISQAGTVLFYVSNSIIASVSTGLFILAGFYILPQEMAVSLGLLLLFLIPYRVLNRKIFIFGQILTNEWEKVNGSLINLIKNNLFIKIYHLADTESMKGKTSLMRYEESYKKYTVSSALITLLPPAYGIIIVSIVSLIFIGKDVSYPINLVSFLYLFLRMAQSASETLGTISFIKLNAPAFKRIYEWLNTPGEEKKKNSIKGITSIKLDQVSFGYDQKKMVLRDVGFEAKKGDFIVIKGASGSGKSTLLSLIMGLQTPSSGNIIINGSVQTEFSLSSAIGYVGPIPYLLNDTVRQNLLFGKPLQVEEKKIFEILDALGLKSVVEKFPNGLEEILHEDAQLSTGQKQRICIARALIQNPEILILDEATANLDSKLENMVIEEINSLKENKIILVVTHKNSFDDSATAIVNIHPLQD